LNSGVHTCKIGTLLPKPHLYSLSELDSTLDNNLLFIVSYTIPALSSS
jgi:hypothetical protein